MKKSAIKYLVLFLIIIQNFACTQGNKEAAGQIENSKSSSTVETNTSGKATFKSPGVAAIYSTYTNLRDALVATDLGTAKKYALELKNALEEHDKFQEASIVAVIHEADEVEVARESFYNLNEALGAILQKNIASGKINKCYCPMARGNQGGSWFTTGLEINNPYFGDKMLKCGSIKETLVAL